MGAVAEIAPRANSARIWDARYEIRAVGVLALGFGLVGLDRFIINPLFPVIAKDLNLNYQDLGLISAILALCWGIASVVTGRLADRIGRKRVLVPAAILFALLVALSGVATGLVSLLLLRGLMGFSEGAYLPASIVATIEASKPTRIGLNVGIQQMAAPLLGLAFGPLIAVWALKVMSWRWIFALVAIPGFLLALLLARVLRESVSAGQPTPSADPMPATPWFGVLKYRNVVFNTIGMFCWMSCLIVITAFMPTYLMDYLKLSLDQMGLVLTGVGVGSFIGMVAVPALSDTIGRKPVVLASLAAELVGLWIRPTGRS